ncbi:TetR/AcrR family transcriptional regulator [Paracoccus alkanivorans]|uniref:TetR/AcrR family transcriptional regulator n=1 Tax=Paracoccus alkanivorans TaxID=2116655 RepID=A0A3M0LXU3_9RHOB|nr:TetR/AcrR family transcriptional regulator [Paracoccus alkanivorans]RMC30196.1 TetR/AcrR family transcriptional regulator [Paracoccus alkanivorans]
MDKTLPMRDRILEAAAEMLVEHGTQAPMSKIAARAGVAAGSLYNHFESKDVLIRAVYDQLAEIINERLLAGDRPELSPDARLSCYIDDYIEFIWNDPKRATLFEYLSNVPLVAPEEMVRTFARSSDYITELLRELRASGWLAKGELICMGGFIGGAIRNSLKWYRIHDRPLTGADREQIKNMCFNALRAPESEGTRFLDKTLPSYAK